jgi:broad specificity phosphatase PhoE
MPPVPFGQQGDNRPALAVGTCREDNSLIAPIFHDTEYEETTRKIQPDLPENAMIPHISFYMIRHGESEANVLNRVAGGGLDTPLTDLGKQQADRLAPLMKQLEIRPSRIFHSPLLRAAETARRINAQLNLQMTEIFDLREHMLGEWENQDWNLVRPLMKSGVKPDGGESRAEFAQRVGKIFGDIFSQEFDGPPMIVAHGGTFHALADFHGFDFGHVDNCVLHRFDPHGDEHPFPWKVWEFKIPEDFTGLEQTRSRSCPVNASRNHAACPA